MSTSTRSYGFLSDGGERGGIAGGRVELDSPARAANRPSIPAPADRRRPAAASPCFMAFPSSGAVTSVNGLTTNGVRKAPSSRGPHHAPRTAQRHNRQLRRAGRQGRGRNHASRLFWGEVSSNIYVTGCKSSTCFRDAKSARSNTRILGPLGQGGSTAWGCVIQAAFRSVGDLPGRSPLARGTFCLIEMCRDSANDRPIWQSPIRSFPSNCKDAHNPPLRFPTHRGWL